MELAATDRAKDEFLAMLAHELRDPLGPLRSALQLVKHPQVSAATVSDMWDIMDRQVGNLTRLVDDLLDVARVTRGQIDMKKAVVDLIPIVRQAVTAMGLMMHTRTRELTLSVVSDGPLYIEADATRMEQVFGNLLNNAAKFGAEPGHIWVTMGVERDQGTGPRRTPSSSGFGMTASGSIPRCSHRSSSSSRRPITRWRALGVDWVSG